jgi:hypothetical protein
MDAWSWLREKLDLVSSLSVLAEARAQEILHIRVRDTLS